MSKSLYLFLFIFVIYLLSLAPNIYVGDSSLFAVASFSLGSAHPPGYPLFNMLGKLATFLPFGNIAFKVNLLSALFGALTCVLVYRTSLELTGDTVASLVSAALCGLSPLMFAEAVKAEVYTLNSFLSMIVFYLGIRIMKAEGKGDVLKSALLGSFVIGLGTGNHHTIGLMGIPLLLAVAIRGRGLYAKLLLMGPAAFASGAIVNLYLYLRSVAITAHGGLIHYSYADSWGMFWTVILRRGFSESSTVQDVSGALSSPAGWLYAIGNSFMASIYASGAVFIPFAVLGLIALARRPLAAGRIGIPLYFSLAVVAWLLVLGKITLAFPSPSQEQVQTARVFFLPLVAIFYTLVAAGIAGILEWIRKKRLTLLRKAAPVLFGLVPFAFLPFSISGGSLAGNYLAYDYMRDMLSCLPVKSLLINYNDNTIFTSFYMRAVERYREDVITMNTGQGARKDTYGVHDSPPWKYAPLFPDFYRSKKSTVSELNRDFADRGALFTSNPLILTDVLAAHYDAYPYVASAALVPKGELAGIARSRLIPLFKENYAKLNIERVRALPYQDDYLTHEIFATYAYTSMVYGDILKREGESAEADSLRTMAFSLSPPDRFLGPYLNFLLQDGRTDEVTALIEELKHTELSAYASSLEQKVLSVLRETGERRP